MLVPTVAINSFLETTIYKFLKQSFNFRDDFQNMCICFRFLPGYYRTMINGPVDLPSYQPSILLVPETLPMTFTERLKNIIIYAVLNRDVSPIRLLFQNLLKYLCSRA